MLKKIILPILVAGLIVFAWAFLHSMKSHLVILWAEFTLLFAVGCLLIAPKYPVGAMLFVLPVTILALFNNPGTHSYLDIATLFIAYSGGYLTRYLYIKKLSSSYITAFGTVAMMSFVAFYLQPKLLFQSKLQAFEVESKMDYRFHTPGGAVVSETDLSGNIVVLDFWFKGCKSCFESLADLKQFNESKPDNVRCFAVNTGKDDDEVLKYVEEKYKIPVLIDSSSLFVEKMNFKAFPQMLVFDRKGVLKYHYSGHLNSVNFTKNLTKLVEDI